MMRRYVALFILILFIFIPVKSFSQLNWTGSQWTDNPVFMRSGYVVMSVLEVTGDASFDGSLYVSGSMDVSTDLTLNTVTVGGDATFDQSIFVGDSLDVSEDLSANTFIVGDMTGDNLYINVDLDVSEDLTANTIVIAGDATFDQSVFAGDSLDVSEDLSTNSLDVTVNTTIGGDVTCDGSIVIGVNLDVTGDITANDIIIDGDFTSDNAFIITDLDVSEDLSAYTLTIDTDATVDNDFYVLNDMDVSEDLSTNTLSISGDATSDGSWYIAGGLDVTGDLTTNSITVSGDMSCDSTVSINDILIYQPSATQVIDGTDDAILANATLIVLNPDADYTTDVTPIIADGTIGQILYITCANGEANRVRLRDEDTLASSNLELGNTSRDISGKDILCVIFDGTDWIELFFQDN